MKVTPVLLVAALGVSATYYCPVYPSSGDAAALLFGYKIQNLLNNYYNSVPVNVSYFSELMGANMTASNNMTLAENTVTNVEGLGKQASLGVEALMEAYSMVGSMPSKCSYTYPAAPNGTAHLMNAFMLEASLCGAFIGLADYVSSPQLSFLMARLSAEHGIHASAISAMMNPVGFMANSTSLTPAFSPNMVLQTGMSVGMLGGYLNGCATAPPAPCGGSIEIGSLGANLTGQTSAGSNICTTMASGAATATSAPGASTVTHQASSTQPTPATFTGGGARTGLGAGIGLAAVGLGYVIM